jgi:hypothetical protein
MPFIRATGRHLPYFGCDLRRNIATDENGITQIAATPFAGKLKAERHPRGGIGVTQCVELCEQTRGAAVDQFDEARIVLAHNISGPTAVTISEGPGDGE